MRYSPIQPLCEKSMQQASYHLKQLTKPVNSLGQLEQIAVQLAGIHREVFPDISRKAVIIMCGDHGVAREGVSAYPQQLTALMIQNFCQGKAAINVLSRLAGAEVVVVDVGSYMTEVPPQVINRKVRYGTENIVEQEAMTEEEAVQAIQAGIDTVAALKAKGIQLLTVGEMGIGNTTIASALTAAFSRQPVSDLVGRGTGIDDQALQRKIQVIEAALQRHQPDPSQPLKVLAQLGGLEVAGMAGCYIGAASYGIPVIVDGVISTVAAYIAVNLDTRVRDYLFASHLSVEPAHSILLKALGLTPMIQARLCLGEASGAALAFPFFDAATAIMREMATFADLGLQGPE